MSEVVLSIGGRKFTVACADGEEDRVTRLGEIIDEKVAAMGITLGLNESQNFLFTSLLLADELSDSEAETETAKESAEAAAASQSEMEASLTGLNERIAALTGECEALSAERERLQAALNEAQSEEKSAQEALATALQAQAESSAAMQDLVAQRSALREELDEQQSDLKTMQAELDAHKARIGALTKERDMALAQTGDNGGDAAEMRETISALEAELARLQSEARSPGGALTDDPDLAPALENFASLLENCADKLEAAAASA